MPILPSNPDPITPGQRALLGEASEQFVDAVRRILPQADVEIAVGCTVILRTDLGHQLVSRIIDGRNILNAQPPGKVGP